MELGEVRIPGESILGDLNIPWNVNGRSIQTGTIGNDPAYKRHISGNVAV
jgi:hypothetical protein